MMAGSPAPSVGRALAQLKSARLDLMAVKRGSSLAEWQALDGAVELIDQAIAMAERVKASRGERRRCVWTTSATPSTGAGRQPPR